MKNVRVTAYLRGAIALPSSPIHLDAMLMWASATRDGRKPFAVGDDDAAPHIPIPMEFGVFQCSSAMYQVEKRGRRFLNRKYPLAESFQYGDRKSPAINVGNGPTKITHKQSAIIFPSKGCMSWMAKTYDVPDLIALIKTVSNIGRLAGHGYGKVMRWECDEVDTWDSFPCVLNGYPTRCLPCGYPGVKGDAMRGVMTVSPPYWDRGSAVECFVPRTPC